MVVVRKLNGQYRARQEFPQPWCYSVLNAQKFSCRQNALIDEKVHEAELTPGVVVAVIEFNKELAKKN